MGRIIFHVDMDAFYASVEQRENPEYRGRPVIVGADPKNGSGRGVVAACSYEARRFGIHSALPISQAYRRCPHGVYVRPRMNLYIEASRQIRQVFYSLTSLVEPMSIDEAFLDMTGKAASVGEARRIALQLKSSIRHEQHLTASVGVAPNKFIAKIASDLQKPDGLVIVPPQSIHEFLDPLPISRIWGVGPKMAERLKQHQLETIAQLRQVPLERLVQLFGKMGNHLWGLSHGIDERPVVTSRNPKSIGHEVTFSEDTRDEDKLKTTLVRLSEKVGERIEKKSLVFKSVCLKLRYSDFTTLTRQSSLHTPSSDPALIAATACRLFADNWDRQQKIRLIGVSVSALQPGSEVVQLSLF